MKSQSIVKYGGQLQEITGKIPELKGTEVLVKVSHCGVCHTELHIQDGYFDLGDGKRADYTQGRSLPFTMGHEIEGTLAAFGPEAEAAAEGVRLGGRYAIYPFCGCGKCSLCARGEETLCPEQRALGVNWNGGFSDYVVVPHPRYLLDCSGIPEGLAGVCMCSGNTSYKSLKNLGNVAEGDYVGIVGLGGLGLMALQFAQVLFPGAHVIACDIDDKKLETAKRMGAYDVCNTSQPAGAKALLEKTGGLTGVIDFVGAASSFYFANRIIRRGGKIVVVGLFGGSFTMPVTMFPMKSITIMGGIPCSLEESAEMLDIVKSGKIQAIPIECRGLSEANRTLDELRAGKLLGRVVLTP